MSKFKKMNFKPATFIYDYCTMIKLGTSLFGVHLQSKNLIYCKPVVLITY